MITTDNSEIIAVFKSYFDALVLDDADEDLIRLHWREAVQQTAQEFPEMNDQLVYKITEEVLWNHLERNEAKVEVNWMQVGF